MLDPKDPNDLVEHFFRHEYANLVSVLTRAFGFARIDLIEDMVGNAMSQAMNTWRSSGVPDNPAGWIHRVAKNKILDSLRREKTHEKALAFSGMLAPDRNVAPDMLLDEWLDETALPDSLLRMIFVCCHPSLDRKSQIALTLKILCGFSIQEIASGLLIKPEAAKKRIQRAKDKLHDASITLDLPTETELKERLNVVHEVLYLMFNEGYSTSHGPTPIRDDVCEEAARLCHLLCTQDSVSSSETHALLALMLFHASRLDTRTDENGKIVLLEDQNREEWDKNLISVAEKWLVQSFKENKPSKYHFEASIAQAHCSAESVETTDWSSIVKLYDVLLDLNPSPIYRLNRAIALGQLGELQTALQSIDEIRQTKELADYYLVECAAGYLHALAGDRSAAIDAYLAALNSNVAEHQKALIESKLSELA